MVGSRQRLAYALQMAVDRQVSLHREIDPTQVILGKLIGRGASGKVYRCVYHPNANKFR